MPSTAEYAELGRPIWLACLVSVSATLLLTAIFSGAVQSIVRRRSLLAAAPICAVLGTLLLAMAARQDLLNPLAMAIAGGVLAGIGTAWLLLAWGEVYGSLCPETVTRCIPSALVAAIAMYYAVSALQPAPRLAATLALPVLSIVLARSSLGASLVQPFISVGARALERVFPWKLALSIAAYGAAFGYMRSPSNPILQDGGGTSPYYFLIANGLPAVALALWALMPSRKLDISRTYRLVLPLVAGGFLLLPFLGSRYAAVADTIVGIGYTCLDLVIWILLSELTFRSGQAPLAVFGWGRFATHAGMLVGTLLGALAGTMSGAHPQATAAASSLIAFTLVLVASFALRDLDLFTGREVVVRSASALSPEDVLFGGCDRLADTCNLTPREREVLYLLARGRNVAHIQAALQLSKSTAKTHVRHVYGKLGVHDRQQLLDIIEQQ